MTDRRPRGEPLDFLADAEPQMADVARHMLGTEQAGRLQLTLEKGVIAGRRFRLTPVGLVIHDDATAQECEDIGELLFGGVARAWGLWLGDFLVAVERRWGRTYQEVAIATGYDVQTLRNLYSICNRVEISRRRYNLTLSHYDVVAALEADVQATWLDYASANNLTVDELRAAMQPRRASATAVSVTPPPALAVFERRFNNFALKALEIAQGADIQVRREMAGKLRELAARLEER